MNRIDSQAEISKNLSLHKKKLKAIQEENTQQIDILKKSHEARLVDIDNKNAESILSVRKEGDKNLIEQANNNEEKLKLAKENLDITKKAIASQEENFKNLHYSKMQDFEDVAIKQSRQKQKETNEFVEEITKNAKDSREKVRDKVDMATWMVRNNAANTITDLSLDNQRVIDVKRQNFEKQRLQKDIEFQTKTELQEKDIAKKTIDMTTEHNRKLNTLQLSQKMTIENETKQSQKKIKDTKAALQYQLKKMQEDHFAAIDKQKELAALALNNLKENTAAEKKLIETRAQDKFYSLSTLNPVVKDLPKAYEISIKVPEHEKDLVNLNVFKRSLRISIARRFQDKSEGPNGAENRTSRSESLTKVLQVPEIMDASKVSNFYKDGVLTFSVDKA
jgi:HSP20 family molecular chaperone IbpA